MDPTGLTIVQKILIGAAVGVVVGLVPLVTGILKKNLKFGLIGFICSMAGGAVFSLLLALPVSAIFTWLIVRGAKAATDTSAGDSAAS